jgi:murein DD-endopeptidase MepM/ murein hydrolase activator NlpD
MIRKSLAALALGISLTLAGCDFIRTPWDGGPPPKTPETPAPLPPGAPAPPPPSAPVTDPYGTGETPADPAPADPSAPDTPSTDNPAPTPDPVTDPAAPDTPADNPTTPVETPVPETPVEPTPVTGPEPAPAPVEPKFSFVSAGSLLPGSGQGRSDQIIFAPGMTFPIKSSPSYLQSMVFRPGGGVAGGDQCATVNFAYPWQDNFCETRTSNRNSPFCPAAKIHQGQDIRVGTPADCKTERKKAAADRELHEAVAVADGVISNVGSYSLTLRGEGVQYKYMHLNMAKLKVKTGDFVKAGDLLGYVSNDFGGTPTVLHLHFEIVQNTAEHGWAHVPPYLSLVDAYERREKGPGLRVEPDVQTANVAPFVIPEGMEIIE